MKLSDFKKNMTDIQSSQNRSVKKKIDLSGINGNDNEDYGDLLVGLNSYITGQDTITDIVLKNITKSSDGMVGITIDESGSDANKTSSKNLLYYMGYYKGRNKLVRNGNNITMTMVADKDYKDEKNQNVDNSEEDIKNLVFGNFQKFAGDPLTKGVGDIKATTQSSIAESDEENTNLLIEEINRIKELLK